MKNLLLTFLTAIFSIVCFGQEIPDASKIRLEKILADKEKLKINFSSTSTKNTLIELCSEEAEIYYKQSKIYEAQKSYEEGMKYLNNELQGDGKKISNKAFGLLESYIEFNINIGNYWIAKDLLLQTEAIELKLDKRKGSFDKIKFLYGKYELLSNNYDEAFSYFYDDIRNVIAKEYSHEELLRVAYDYYYLSELELKLNRPWKSLHYAEKGLKYANYYYVKNSEDIKALICNNISKSYLNMGDNKESLKYNSIAYKIIVAQKSKESFQNIGILITRAELQWREKRYDLAKETFRAANKVQLDYVIKVLPNLSEREKENFYALLVDNTNILYSFSIDYLASISEKIDADDKLETIVFLKELADIRINTKSKILSESNKIQEIIQKTNDPELVYVYDQWKKQKNKLSLLIGQQSHDTLAINKLTSEISQSEKYLSKIVYKENLSSENPLIFLRDIPTNMSDYSTAVEIIRVPKYRKPVLLSKKELRMYMRNDTGSIQPRFNFEDPTYLYLAIDNKSELDYAIATNGKEMETKGLPFYFNTIKLEIEDDQSYAYFVKPMERWLNKNTTVYISADGVYNQFSIGTIKDPRTKNYLQKDKLVYNINNLEELTHTKKKKVELKTALLLGRPAYSATVVNNDIAENTLYLGERSIEEFHNSKIADLPGTELEINSISLILKSKNITTESYLGNEATETILKEHKSVDLLHIATHGFFVKSTSGDNSNPMMRSGLLLAGVSDYNNDREDDGILTAYEASNIDLKNTKLVILSACETGVGELKDGEGVYGLQRAFQIAGVKYVLLSMWKVDDMATKELMTSFYTHLSESKDIPESFQNAQSEMRQKYQSPYYWGAFKLLGI